MTLGAYGNLNVTALRHLALKCRCQVLFHHLHAINVHLQLQIGCAHSLADRCRFLLSRENGAGPIPRVDCLKKQYGLPFGKSLSGVFQVGGQSDAAGNRVVPRSSPLCHGMKSRPAQLILVDKYLSTPSRNSRSRSSNPVMSRSQAPQFRAGILNKTTSLRDALVFSAISSGR